MNYLDLTDEEQQEYDEWADAQGHYMQEYEEEYEYRERLFYSYPKDLVQKQAEQWLHTQENNMNETKDYILAEISGGYTLISSLDAEVLNSYTWFIDSDGYATTFNYGDNIKSIRLHQLIAGKEDGLFVDHKNRVRLDNRRSNLRHVNWQESCNNRGAQVKDSNTPYLQTELHVTSKKGNDVLTVMSKALRTAKPVTV